MINKKISLNRYVDIDLFALWGCYVGPIYACLLGSRSADIGLHVGMGIPNRQPSVWNAMLHAVERAM